MILNDNQIHGFVKEGMVENYLPELINPASLDLRLGDLIMLESVESHQMIPLNISKYTAEHPYPMVPGQFILAQTIEVFNMPETIAGLFFLKSSRAREGYENLHAGYADPGWHGSAEVGHYNDDKLVSASKQFLCEVNMPLLDAAA